MVLRAGELSKSIVNTLLTDKAVGEVALRFLTDLLAQDATREALSSLLQRVLVDEHVNAVMITVDVISNRLRAH